MFTKSLAAAALAGLIGIATLGLSTATASAGYWVGGGYWSGGGNYGGGNYNAYPSYPTYPSYRAYPNYPVYPNYDYNVRPRPYYPVQPTVQQVCKPIYKTVQVWKLYYGWVWRTVYAGQRCWYQQAYPSQSYGYSNGW